ncbi:MAG: DUF3850 domain-containing protein [Clostridiales bacterium]|nr:DUF3850 domain-containing protein [Clostridiales bacterium]
MTHHLKITPKHFKYVLSGKKNVELRFNDRNFKVGDKVELQEYLGKTTVPKCPASGYCTSRGFDEETGAYRNCGLKRNSCDSYVEHKYSGKSVYATITDVFDVSDVVPNFVLFKFEIYNKKI